MPVLKQIPKREKLRADLFEKIATDGGEVADTIKNMRKILGWDQKALAKSAGISLSALRRIEQGSRSIRLDTLEKILHLFKLRLVVKSAARTT